MLVVSNRTNEMLRWVKPDLKIVRLGVPMEFSLNWKICFTNAQVKDKGGNIL
jgi:hypothetical protein